MGCQRGDICTHSSRKFAESTSASKIDGPSKDMVCLRAGQSVGRTQDCYMKAEEGGDALVGRTVAQLKFNADEFDVLPPHFGPNTLQELNERGWNTTSLAMKIYLQTIKELFHSFLQVWYIIIMQEIFSAWEFQKITLCTHNQYSPTVR